MRKHVIIEDRWGNKEGEKQGGSLHIHSHCANWKEDSTISNHTHILLEHSFFQEKGWVKNKKNVDGNPTYNIISPL